MFEQKNRKVKPCDFLFLIVYLSQGLTLRFYDIAYI